MSASDRSRSPITTPDLRGYTIMMVPNASERPDSDVDNNGIYLDEWNRELQKTLIPNDVILILFLIFGILGNGLVLYVYHRKITRDYVARRFIFDLAVVDLLASVSCSASDLAMTLMPAKYYSSKLCKGTWVVNVFLTGMSVFILVIITIERYLKLCYPFGPFMTRRKERILKLVSVFLSIFFCIPPLFIYGSVPFQNRHGNITGYRCSILKSEFTHVAHYYGITLMVLFAIIVTALVIMYGRIGYALHQHFKRMSKFRSMNSLDGVGSKQDLSKSQRSLDKINEGNEKLKRYDNTIDNNQQKTTPVDSSQNLVLENAQTHLSPEAEDKEIMFRFTMMFVLITIVFLLCYATKGTIMVFEALDPYFWEKHDDVPRAIMIFVYNLYIFSYVINPIIFAVFDSQFKTELNHIRSVLRRCCRKS